MSDPTIGGRKSTPHVCDVPIQSGTINCGIPLYIGSNRRCGLDIQFGRMVYHSNDNEATVGELLIVNVDCQLDLGFGQSS